MVRIGETFFMLKEFHISRLVRNLIILGLSSSFLFLVIFSYVHTKPLINQPFAGFLVLKNNLVNLIYLSEWEGFKSGIKVRDVVVAVNGQPVGFAAELEQAVRKTEHGAPLTYTIMRGDKRLEITVPVTIFTAKDYYICFLFWTLVGMIFLVMGLIVFYVRPDYPASWSFLAMGAAVGFSNAAIWEHCATHINHIPLYLFPFLGSSVMFIGLYFPEVRRVKRILLPVGLVATAAVVSFYRYSFLDISLYQQADIAFWIYTVITSTIGVSLMGYSFMRSTNQLTRQKGKLVIYGFIAAFLGGWMVLIGAVALQKISFFWFAIPVLFVPFSLGYAIVKRSLLDVDAIFFRSLSYLLVAGIVLVLSFVVIGEISILLQDIIGESSSLAAVITTLIMVAIFRPLQALIEGFISRRFFEEKYYYRETIMKAIKVLASIIDLEELLYQILDTILFAVKAEKGIILLNEKDTGRYYLAAQRDFSGGFSPVAAGEAGAKDILDLTDGNLPIYDYLKTNEKPLQVSDIEYLDVPRETRDSMTRFMRDYGIVLSVPIVYEWRLIGVLGIGAKKTGELYSKDDIDVFMTLMMQTAVSIENARKVQELKRMVELETSYRELARLNELKDNFLSMVSHDLRTPMTSIKGYAALLYQSPEKIDAATTREYLAIIMDETDRLTRLINNILDIQRFEAGNVVLEMADIDVVRLVNESLGVFYSAATVKKITVDKQVQGKPIMIKGHRDRLLQVLANFLSNAIKFTQEGGRIKAFVERIEIDHEPSVRVSISDTGPGIPKDKKDKMFQKFQQVEKLVRQKEEGSGLGLALAREIIDYHQGKIGVESYPGKGSVFYFILRTSN